MELIININNGIEEPTRGYENCNTNQMLIFGGYDEVREFVYPSFVWVNTIPNPIDTSMLLPRYEGPSSCKVYIPKWYRKQKYCQIHVPYYYKNKLKSSLKIAEWYLIK